MSFFLSFLSRSTLYMIVNAAAGNFLANAHELSANGFKTVIGSYNFIVSE